MTNIIEELKQKRRTIEQFQRDKARQEGEKAQLSKQLKDECGEDSVEKAEKIVEREVKELEQHKKYLEELDKELDQIICSASPGSNSGPSNSGSS